MSNQELNKKIEQERKQLIELYKGKGNFLDSQILAKSSQLDKLIIKSLKKHN